MRQSKPLPMYGWYDAVNSGEELAQPPEIEDYLQDAINEEFGKAHKYVIFKTNWSEGQLLFDLSSRFVKMPVWMI